MNSLLKDKDKYSENLVALMAGRVEEAIFKLHNRRTDVKYKNKIRSRHANLKDARNPDLRSSVMEGMITPEGKLTMVIYRDPRIRPSEARPWSNRKQRLGG